MLAQTGTLAAMEVARRRTVRAADVARRWAVSQVMHMKIDRSSQKAEEPMGIVISRGSRDEATPLFWAYVWGPAPEQDAGQVTPKAA